MNKFFAAFAGLMLLVASASTFALQANGWRLNITESADNETPVSIMEIEYLYDDDSSSATPDVDMFEADLGHTACSAGAHTWSRVITSGTYAGTYEVGCDTFTSNRRGEPNTTITIVSDWRAAIKTRRQIYTLIDNNFLTYWTTTDKVTAADPFSLQYMFYTGADAPSRTLPDVTSYAITVPAAMVDTGAPVAWTFEYHDPDAGAWFQDHVKTSDDVNWSSAATVYKVSTDYYLVDGTTIRMWDGTSDWGAALSGTALTTAQTAISDSGTIVGYRLEFDL